MTDLNMGGGPRVRRWLACLGLAVCLIGGRDAMAEKWPGEGASFGGAIAAKVVGERCPGVLSVSDIAEVDAYLARYATESAALEDEKSKRSGDAPFPLVQFQRSLKEKYERTYRDPANCDAGAAEQAQDMVLRVRKAMAGGGPLISKVGAPPIGEAANARIAGVMCPGALTGAELARLELYVGQYWTKFVKSASDEDTRTTMLLIEEAEAMQVEGWDPAKDCTAARISDAKAVLARIPQEP